MLPAASKFSACARRPLKWLLASWHTVERRNTSVPILTSFSSFLLSVEAKTKASRCSLLFFSCFLHKPRSQRALTYRRLPNAQRPSFAGPRLGSPSKFFVGENDERTRGLSRSFSLLHDAKRSHEHAARTALRKQVWRCADTRPTRKKPTPHTTPSRRAHPRCVSLLPPPISNVFSFLFFIVKKMFTKNLIKFMPSCSLFFKVELLSARGFTASRFRWPSSRWNGKIVGFEKNMKNING